MKKIVSAVALASLVAGAFATDAKITLNYRSKLDAYSQRSVDGGDLADKTTTKEWLDWEGYDGAGKQSAINPSDTFKFVLDGDRAGATFAVNLNTNASSYTLNQYSGWMKWDLGPGTLKLESGNWKDGYANGNYRVKKDVDAMNAEGTDFERFKLGSILGKTQGAFNGKNNASDGKYDTSSNKLTFVDNLDAVNSVLANYATYSLPLDDLKLEFTLGGIYNAYDKVADGDTTTYYDSYLVSRISASLKNAFDAELIYKHPDQHENVVALYVMPKIMDELTLNIGGAIDSLDLSKDDGGYTDWGFDLRARYAVDKQLSFTFFTNISGTDLDAGRMISSGIAGRKGAYGLTGSAYSLFGYDSNTALADKGEASLAVAHFKTAMWNHLGVRYVVNDSLAATFNVGLITPLSKIKDDDNNYGPEWRIVPAVQVYASSNASIWGGIAISGWSGKINDNNISTFNVDIPVIFRVKM